MKKIKFCIAMILMIFIGCAGNKQLVNIAQKTQSTEELIEAYPPNKPQWLIFEPESDDKNIYFIGMSDKLATEKDARDNALRASVKAFAGYCGIEVKELRRAVTAEYSLSSEIKDAVTASLTDERQSIDALVSRVKPVEWYIEKWAVKSGRKIIDYYYKAHLKAAAPRDEYNRVIEYKENQAAEKQKQLSEMPIELQFAFVCRTGGRSERLLENNDAVYSGDEFRIIVRANQDCYLYIFNIDSTGEINQIFPVEDKIQILNPIRAANKYIIPPDLIYKFDNNKGIEKFFVFGFKQEITDFSELKSKMRGGADSAEKRVFINNIAERFTARGTTITKAQSGAVLGLSKLMPDIITGKDYIKRVYEFEHR